MSKFTKGDKVIVTDEKNEVKKGTIKTLFEELRIAIVEYNKNAYGKVSFDRISLDSDEKESQNIAKNVKRISKSDFIKIVTDVTLFQESEDREKIFELIYSLAMTKIVDKLIGKLYCDGNEIELSKYQLDRAIKDVTALSSLLKMTNDEMTFKELIPVSLLATERLYNLIPAIFDESEND